MALRIEGTNMDRFALGENQKVAFSAYPVFSEDFFPLHQKSGKTSGADTILFRRGILSDCLPENP